MVLLYCFRSVVCVSECTLSFISFVYKLCQITINKNVCLLWPPSALYVIISVWFNLPFYHMKINVWCVAFIRTDKALKLVAPVLGILKTHSLSNQLHAISKLDYCYLLHYQTTVAEGCMAAGQTGAKGCTVTGMRVDLLQAVVENTHRKR